MTQKNNPTRISSKSSNQRSLFMQGVAWLSGISMLSSSVAIAQTQPSSDAVAVPSAQDLLAPAIDTAPAAPAPAPVAPAPVREVKPQRAPVAAPDPVVSQPEAPVRSSAPAASVAEPQPIESSRPLVTLPETPIDRADLERAIQSPAASPATSPAARSIDASNAYIDSTNYNIGATRSDQPSVVLSERSTGCQTTLQVGQGVPNSICQSKPIVTAASSGGAGASRRRAGSVSLGPVNLSVTGFRAASNSSSGRDFYNLTTRPLARLGNGNTSLMFPLSIPAVVTSVFGWRMHPVAGTYRFHSGTDLGAPMGTPVLAAYAGRVAIADFMRGYGLTVILQHEDKTKETLYAHMSELFVQPGEWVDQGTVIGRVGSTGLSTGPHLHFEFRQLTPEGWLAMDPGQMLTYALAQLTQSPPPVLANAQTKPLDGLQLINWAVPTFEGVATNLGKDAKTVVSADVKADARTTKPSED